MHPVIYIFSHRFFSYDLITHAAYVIAIIYYFRQLSKIHYIRKNDLILFFLAGFVVQEIGGSLIPHLYQWIYKGRPYVYGNLTSPGRYFHSVFLSMLIYTVFICRKLKWPTYKVLDYFFISAIIMSGLGRIGCYMQGCCKGKAADVPWCVTFPNSDICRHPTQLYMFYSESILLIVLLWINKHKKYDGQTFWLGVFLYSIYRFTVEFWRTNPVFIYNISHAQVFSIFTFLIALVVLIRKKDSTSIS